MRTVQLNVAETDLGGPGALSRGLATFEYVAGGKPFTTVDGAGVTLARPIPVPIVNGQPTTPIELAATQGVCCVRATVRSHVTGRDLVRHVEIPTGDGPVDFASLIDVDPDSYTPVEVTPTLMDTIFAALRGEFDATVFRIDGGNAATIHPEETS